MTAPRPDDQPVGRRPGDQVVDRPAAALRGDDQRAVLDERPRVAEVLDVLPRRALPGRPAAGHHVRPGRVEPDGVAVEHLTEVGPDPVEIQPRAAGLLRHGHVQRLEEGQRVACRSSSRARSIWASFPRTVRVCICALNRANCIVIVEAPPPRRSPRQK